MRTYNGKREKDKKNPAFGYLHEALGLLSKTPVSSKEHVKCACTPPQAEIYPCYTLI